MGCPSAAENTSPSQAPCAVLTVRASADGRVNERLVCRLLLFYKLALIT